MNIHRYPNILCPYCHEDAEFDFRIYGRPYYHCHGCDLIFKGEGLNEDRQNLAEYYEKKYFSDYSQDQVSEARNAVFSHILDRIEREILIGKLLDVGCGCGFFLKDAKRRGWNITGIDPSEESIAYSEKLLSGVFAYKGTLTDVSLEKDFDVITMINVLEHSPEPWLDIEKAVILLKPGGLIFLRFPNGNLHSTLLKISKKLRSEKFAEKYLVFHEFSFTKRFIGRLLSDHGFSKIVINNAILSGGVIFNPLFTKMVGIIVNSMYAASGGKIIMSPSLEIMARKT